MHLTLRCSCNELDSVTTQSAKKKDGMKSLLRNEANEKPTWLVSAAFQLEQDGLTARYKNVPSAPLCVLQCVCPVGGGSSWMLCAGRYKLELQPCTDRLGGSGRKEGDGESAATNETVNCPLPPHPAAGMEVTQDGQEGVWALGGRASAETDAEE